MKKLQVNGMNAFLWLGCCLVIIIAVCLGVMPNEMAGAIAICLGFGSITMFIGERLPIWNTFLGGGALLTMFLGSAIKYFKLLPDTTIQTVRDFIGTWNFLNVFIIALVVGSIMAIDRKLLLWSVTRYIPCILAAVVGAGVLCILVGMIFGKSPAELLSVYMLPIMAAGSGSGAIPLAEMYAEITGADYDAYLTVAMAVLSIANIMAIIAAAAMGKLSSKMGNINGGGKLIRKGGTDAPETVDLNSMAKPTLEDLGSCLLILFAIYMGASLISAKILPSILGAKIHMFAYAVIITVILKVANVIPENITSALIYTQKYFVTATVVIVMFCCGMSYVDLGTFMTVLTNPVDFLIALAVVVGAILGGGGLGWLVGFYPYEAAVTAGLCMANSGGTGDVAVLSGCKRMNLMPYAQISSRIGNAIILILGSLIFSIMF